MQPHLQMQSVDWLGSDVKKAVSRLNSLLVGRPHCAHRNIAQVLASVDSNPTRPASKQAQVLGMSDSSVRRILRSDLNLRPYKLQVVYALRDRDKEVRLQFCRHFRGILTENPDLPNNLMMSNEELFHVHCRVSNQNFR
jgi:AraC-like DNA-binding protein